MIIVLGWQLKGGALVYSE